MVSDPKLSLAKLAEVLERTMTTEQKLSAAGRAGKIAKAKEQAIEKAWEQDQKVRHSQPLHFSRFMEELAEQAPSDVIIFDEALTNSPALTRYITPKQPGTFFQTRGGSLGVGIPGAIGVQMANPGKTVIGVTGDGGSMYTIQALWSAARHNVPAKFIICNNRSYRLLQLNVSEYWRENGVAQHEFPLSFDLSKPAIDFAAMSRAMGVAAARVETVDQIAPAIREMLAHQGPFLLEVVLEGDVHPDHIGVRCGQ
jgi:benzoylformate decarboxylase